MATSLTDLIAQKEALERQINAAQSQAKADAITRVRELMSQHGLIAADLTEPLRARQSTKTGRKVEPKYRDPLTGSTWTGRGLKPKWLATAIEGGKTLSDFVI